MNTARFLIPQTTYYGFMKSLLELQLFVNTKYVDNYKKFKNKQGFIILLLYIKYIVNI